MKIIKLCLKKFIFLTFKSSISVSFVVYLISFRILVFFYWMILIFKELQKCCIARYTIWNLLLFCCFAVFSPFCVVEQPFICLTLRTIYLKHAQLFLEPNLTAINDAIFFLSGQNEKYLSQSFLNAFVAYISCVEKNKLQYLSERISSVINSASFHC